MSRIFLLLLLLERLGGADTIALAQQSTQVPAEPGPALVETIASINSGLAHSGCHDFSDVRQVCIRDGMATTGLQWHVLLFRSTEVTDHGETCVLFSETDIDLAKLDPTYVVATDDWMGAHMRLTTTDSKDALEPTWHGVPEDRCKMAADHNVLNLYFQDAPSRDRGATSIRHAIEMAGGKASMFSRDESTYPAQKAAAASTGSGPSLDETLAWLTAFLPVATRNNFRQGDDSAIRGTDIRVLDGCQVTLKMSKTYRYQSDSGSGSWTSEMSFSLASIDPHRTQVESGKFYEDPFSVMVYTRDGVKSVRLVHKSLSESGDYERMTDHATIAPFIDKDSVDRVVRALGHAADLCPDAPAF